MEHLKEFINRCKTDEFQEYVKEIRKENHRKINQWAKDNPKKFKKSQKRYFKSKKGKVARLKVTFLRKKWLHDGIEKLSWADRKNIRAFYNNCPEDYEVDHIRPLSRGGKHELSNLQYLTREENRRKGNLWNNDKLKKQYPRCDSLIVVKEYV